MGGDELPSGAGPAGVAPLDGAPVPVRRMSGGYRPPELLAARHELSRFECRSREQTDWLRRHARQSAAAGTTRALVVTNETGRVVVAYYAWCMAQLTMSAAPERLRKGAGRYPQPM